ncbi:MAG: type I secretion system permease/ATPase [Limnohabitans sp.]
MMWRPQWQPLTRILLRFRKELLATLLFSMVSNLLMLTPTLYMLQIYDRVMISRNEMTLLAASLLALLFLLIMLISDWLRSQLLVRFGVRFDQMVHPPIFQAIFESALTQRNANPGEAMGMLLQLRQFLSGHGFLAFLELPWTPVYIGISWLLHPILGWLSLLFVVLFIAMARWIHHQRVNVAGQSENSRRQMTSFLLSRTRHADVISAMGMLKGVRQRWQTLQRANLWLGVRLDRQDVRQHQVQHFVQYAQQSLVLAAGAWLVVRGELSMGSMIAANVMMSRALVPVQTIASSWRSFFQARQAYTHLNTLLSSTDERTGISLPKAPRGRLQLQDFSALVEGRDKPVLDGLNLEFNPGDITVIVGPSGSGKSTLARCLLDIWPLTEGRLLLDGEAVSLWDRQELGRHMGYMPQDVQLMAGTVAENIARMGHVDADKVVQAAQAAAAHDLILHLPQGYDTPLDHVATQLSAGHRQRIALARAIYGEPALVVLDEPNSNLDDAGEAALLQALLALRQAGKTVIVVSHRGNLVQMADRMVCLKDGRIAAQGPRDAVLAQMAEQRRQDNLNSSAQPVT